MSSFLGMHMLEFPEHHIKNYETETVHDFDLSAKGLNCPPDFKIRGYFSFEHYCQAIFDKLLELSICVVDDFIEHQLQMKESPLVWLGCLQSLLRKNKPMLLDLDEEQKYKDIMLIVRDKCLQLSEKQTNELRVLIEEYRHMNYNINKVKREVEGIHCFEQKYTYLLEQKTHYLQNRPYFLGEESIPFDKLIDFEMEKARQEEQIRMARAMHEHIPKTADCRFQTDMSIPELTLLFRMLIDTGLLRLMANKTSFFKFIADHFETRNSKDISWRSVRNHYDRPYGKAVGFWQRWLGELEEWSRRWE